MKLKSLTARLAALLCACGFVGYAQALPVEGYALPMPEAEVSVKDAAGLAALLVRSEDEVAALMADLGQDWITRFTKENNEPSLPSMSRRTYSTSTKDVFVFQAKDKSEDIMSTYGDWYCDYVVSFDQDVAADSVILTGAYGTQLATILVGMPFEGNNVTKQFLISSMGFNMNYNAIVENVGTFICTAINISRENIGKTINVSLVMWPSTGNKETDSVTITTIPYTFTEANLSSIKIPGDGAEYRFVSTGLDEDGLVCNGSSFVAQTEAGPHFSPVAYVAQIGETKYETLQAALNAAESGDTVKLLADIAPTALQTVDGVTKYAVGITKSIVLDGNGKSISCAGSVLRGIGIKGDSADAKIDVVISNLTVNARTSEAKGIFTRGNLNSLTLSNVKIYSEGINYPQPLTISGNAQNNIPAVLIDGCYIESDPDCQYGYAIINYVPAAFTITNSEIKGWACLYAKGGAAGTTYDVKDSSLISKNLNPGDWNAFGTIVIEEQNVAVTVTNSVIDVSGAENDQTVANFSNYWGDTTGSSVTLGDGNTVSLKEDALITKGASNDGYSGGTISISGGRFDRPVATQYLADGYICVGPVDGWYTVVEGAYVAQIGDSLYEKLDDAISAAQDGDTVKLLSNLELTQMLIIPNGKNFTLDLNGKEITASDDTWTAGDMLICVSYGATLTIDNSLEPTGGFIFADTNDSVLGAIKMTNKGDDPENGIATLIVKAGWIEGNYYGISGNGTRQGTYVRIESGYVCATHETEGIGIYQPQNGTLIITGDAMVDGMAAAVYVKSGYVEVSDEAFLSCEGEAGEYSPSGDGANPTGDVLVIDNCGYPGGAPTASITGGLFDSLNGKAVASYASAGNEPVVGFVSGGIFSSEIPQEYCADGYIPGGLDDEWNMYVVKEGGYVAKILGGLKYEALPEAVAAVQNGQTIVLLSDVTLDAPMDVAIGTKEVILDLGGKTLTGRTNLKGGKLTIQNGTVAGGNQQALNVYGSATAAENYSVLTIDKTVTVTADVYGVCLFGNTAGSNGYGAVINIEGAVVTTGDGKNGAVFVSGNLGWNTENANNVINVTGSITSATDAAIALNGLATVNVKEGAEVVGNTAIAVKRGTLNVTGGTIHATGDKNYGVAAYNNGTEMTGAAISITPTYSQYGALAVEISGGSVISDNADALYMKEGTYVNAATMTVSGGYFSDRNLEDYLVEGKLCTTKLASNGLYAVVPEATVTYTLAEGAPAGAVRPDPAYFTYPSGDLAEIALAVATCTDNGYTFGGWQMTVDDKTKVVSALPAGTKGNVTLVATWTKATKVTIQVAAPTYDNPEATESIEVKLPDAWLEDTTVVNEVVKTNAQALNDTADNGLKVWENYVLGQDPTTKVEVESEQGASETAMPVKNTLAVQPVDTGFTVKYSLDKVSSSQSSATVEQKGQEQDTSDLELNLKEATSGDSNVAYYKMTATIQKTTGETVSTVHSENTIGVLAVKEAPATAIIGVPWSSSTDSTSISVNDLVRTANLTPGDELKIYDPTTKTYKMWTLDDDKEWEPVPTSSGTGTSGPGEADVNTVARGAGVWLTRQNPDEPIYLVGQATAEAAPTELEKATAENGPAWNLVASPSVEEIDIKDIASEEAMQGDTIIVPTKTAPKTYTYDQVKGWGYQGVVGQKTYFVPGLGQVTTYETGHVNTDTKLPVGQGFWYLNSTTTGEKQLDWSKKEDNTSSSGQES